MAEKVELIITAQDSASQILRGITSNLGEFGNVIQGITAGRGLETLTGEVIKFGKESVQEFTDTAQAAKQLADASGQTTEEASRMLETLDDFGLSLQDALTATRALTKQGLVPNLETLEKLSDQYKAIQDPQQRNEFLMKNLGRAGQEWNRVLQQGSENIREHAAAISQGLIVTDKMWQEAEKNRVAIDEWNDAWKEIKLTVGGQVLPVFTQLIDNTEITREVSRRAKEEMEQNNGVRIHTVAEIRAQVVAEREAAQATMTNTQSTIDNTAASQANAETIKALTQANQDHLNLIQNFQSLYETYTSKEKDLMASHEELIAEKQKLIAQGYSPEGQTILDVNQKLADNEAAQKQNAEAVDMAVKTKILAMLTEQAAADGLSKAETDKLLDLGLKWHVYSQSAVDMAKKAEDEMNGLAGAINDLPDNKTITIKVDTVYSGTGSTTPGQPMHAHASGGTFMIPQSYGNEGFRMGNGDTASGGETVTITPRGQSANGGGVNVTVMYSPMLSLGNAAEIQQKLTPLIINGIKEAKAQGVIV